MHRHDPHGFEDFPSDPREDGDALAVAGPSEEIEGLEMFHLLSVGMDIGSATTHLVFSRLTLRREGAAFSSRFRVTERRVLYRSPILLTPYLSGTLIDTNKIQAFVHRSYREAGFVPEAVDTGAVVITGEALKKENAQPIAELFARESGRFICATAGPNHEALLAAHGCGAVALSQREAATVLNIDVGGGTTKLSLIRQGVVAGTAAINVGARLLAFDHAGVVERLEQPGKLLLRRLGHALSVGQPITEGQKNSLAARMAALLFEVVQGGPMSHRARELLITGPLRDYQGPGEVDLVVFSGGVSEYIYGRHQTSYGDLGPQLANHIRERLDGVFHHSKVREAGEGIRATVIGAGEYTIQASGSTSHLSGAASLPAFGLQVVRPLLDGKGPVAEALQQALAKLDLDGFKAGLALALTVDQPPDYQSLKRLADGISALANRPGSEPAPLFIVVDLDVAKSLGGILKEELRLAQDVVVVDGIDVGDLDYLDIGQPMGISEVVPVTVKSLIFPHHEGGT